MTGEQCAYDSKHDDCNCWYCGSLSPHSAADQAQSWSPNTTTAAPRTQNGHNRMNSHKKRRAFPNPALYFHPTHRFNLNGNSRGVLPVNRATAFANAGASGGNPGSPMPVGGSALAMMCTATWGMSVMRARRSRRSCFAPPRRPSGDGGTGQAGDRPISARPAPGLPRLGVDGQVAVHAGGHAVQLGRAVFADGGFHHIIRHHRAERLVHRHAPGAWPAASSSLP